MYDKIHYKLKKKKKEKQKKARECLVCKQAQSLSRVPTLSQPYGQQSASQMDKWMTDKEKTAK